MLEGRTVIVVERQFLIAMDIQRILQEAGASTVVFARTVAEARSLSTGWGGFGLAVVELAPDLPDATALSEDLFALGVPLVLTTSDTDHQPKLEPRPPLLAKPFSERDFLAACSVALDRDSA